MVPIPAVAVQFAEVLRFLKDRSFSGWVSVEEASEHGYTGIRDAYVYIKENLE